MKVALMQYWLVKMGGAEKVLAALGEIYPQADLFTHAYWPKGVTGFEKFKVTESFIAKLPLGRRRPQCYLPLLPMANRSFDLNGYDLVLSSESGPIKGIRKPEGACHVCYCHTPMRYIWDMYDEYYSRASAGGKIAMRIFCDFMRREDLKSADSVDAFVANSSFVAERIRRIYGRDSVVVHPPVDVGFFAGEYEKKDYYLFASRLELYKRPDLVIEACTKMNRSIVVIGNGNMQAELLKRYAANPLVTFLGRVSDDELRRAYGEAKAFIFPALEDFGIVPVEAQAAGTPVIALGKGGSLETVRGGETGVFMPEASCEALCNAIEEFESCTWDPALCRKNAARFTKERFIEGFRNAVDTALRTSR